MTALRVLIVDHEDSFTFNLEHLFVMAGASVAVKSSRTLELSASDEFSHVVLSPGPGRPEAWPRSLQFLRGLGRRQPLLGVCLGHQMLACDAGVPVERLGAPCHGRATRIRHDGSSLFNGIADPCIAARYHSLCVRRRDLRAPLAPIAWDESDPEIVMAMADTTAPRFGIQFHPESFMTPDGLRLARNFLSQG